MLRTGIITGIQEQSGMRVTRRMRAEADAHILPAATLLGVTQAARLIVIVMTGILTPLTLVIMIAVVVGFPVLVLAATQ